jgi:PAS domain S-box-containing protein
LTDKRGELELTIERLNREVERRQIVSEALRNAQQQYYETMEAAQAGVYIITDGCFTYANQSLADMLGIAQQTLIGSEAIEYIFVEDRGLVEENMARRFNGENIPPYRVRFIREDGTTFHGEIWAKVTVWQGKTSIVGTVTDVSLIKQNEEKLQRSEIQLRQSLAEKETLLKEIYHRTKNNMLVIISMLELQAQDVRDEKITEVFKETENRIRAMALVHEKLYQSQSLSEINLGSYIREVVTSLVINMAPEGKIGVHFDLHPCPINIDYAVPLGLVINEIVTNSVKHGFPADQKGSVFVRLRQEQNNNILLDVGDDGVGLAPGITLDSATSFGMQIVRSLIRLQLKGQVSLDGGHGTCYNIRFTKPWGQERV